MNSLTTFLGLEVKVEFDYHAAMRGARDSLGGVRNAGPPLEPDEPAEVEITSVKFGALEILDALDADQLNTLEGECMEQLESEANDCPEPPDDDLRDARD